MDQVLQRVARSDVAVASAAPAGRLTVALFTLTAFVGAGLLFVVQPMVAKLLLPSYGGSATVWSTSSLFFQIVLLLAYGYAHAATTRLGRRRQPRLHLFVLALPLVALPVALPPGATPDGESAPVLWLLRTLVLMIGLPFAVVATTGPLLQRWYSWTDHVRSDDPYFLFAASNLGSFCGLLAYPFLIEPHVSLDDQRTLWTWGFVVFAVLTAGCALRAGALVRGAADVVDVGPLASGAPAHRVERRRATRWLLLAFLPSTLMLGVTSHLSTDVAPIPLLWVVPLAIYLATFVLAFGRTSRVPPVAATRLAVGVALAGVLVALVHEQLAIEAVVAVNLLLLAVVAYAAHARLAADRPEPAQLTAYYLVIAVGGALGGLLNGVVAPVVFDRLLEYPLALVAVPLLVVGLPVSGARLSLSRQFHSGTARAGIVIVLVLLAGVLLLAAALASSGVLLWLTLAAALGLGLWVATAPVAVFALVAGLFVLAGGVAETDTLARERSFYGAYLVKEEDGRHVVAHGTTVHGSQFWDEEGRTTPTTYYSRTGPVGIAFDALGEARTRRVGVIGLGAGTIAAYGREGQRMTFFEIDPGIVRLARDPNLFTYLADSDADIETVVGDGRLRLAERAAGDLDLLVLDAFSSDSIPVHLLTRDAMAVYRDSLAPDGVLMVHISNRVFDLEPVVAGAAVSLGWTGAVGSLGAKEAGASTSRWVVLSPDDEVVAALVPRPGWRELDRSRTVRWTDDYSSVLEVLR